MGLVVEAALFLQPVGVISVHELAGFQAIKLQDFLNFLENFNVRQLVRAEIEKLYERVQGLVEIRVERGRSSPLRATR